jgi:hypothetical protein
LENNWVPFDTALQKTGKQKMTETKRAREKRESWWGRGMRETTFAVLKVPRQCPLALQVDVRLVCGISLILILKKLERLQWG